MLEITETIRIPQEQLTCKAVKSSGPGGQHVNKTNTRVTLYFDLANSSIFTDAQKKRILSRLRSRATKKGVIFVVSQKFRSQKANRDLARHKLAELIRSALKRKKQRKKTKLPRWANQKRLDEKSKRAQLKKQRSNIKLPPVL